jgi:hypothetical protein
MREKIALESSLCSGGLLLERHDTLGGKFIAGNGGGDEETGKAVARANSR